jgi:tetratricopeptide (TPR) repeat protein
VELACEFLGKEHNETLRNTIELGSCLRAAGAFSESEAVLRDGVAKLVSIFGEDNLGAIVGMGDLGRLLMETGNYKEAIIWYEKAFRSLLKVSGWSNVGVISYSKFLGECYERQGQYTDCIALYENAVNGHQMLKETSHKNYFYFIHRLAEYYIHEGRHAEAITICNYVRREIEHKRLPEDLGWEISISDQLALGHEQQWQYDSAAALYEQNITKIRGTKLWNYEWCRYYCLRLGSCYENLERYCDALVLYKRSQEEIRGLKGPDHPDIAEIQGWIDWIDFLSNQTCDMEWELDLKEDD